MGANRELINSGGPDSVNQTLSPIMATTVLQEASKPNVSFLVNNIVLKDTQVGDDLQSGNLRISSVVKSNNLDGQSIHVDVEHGKIDSHVLSKQHRNGIQTKPLGGMRSHRMTS
ncbi:unnamed protein product [Linum trigynum]|uniref:Uncharacterized protein n=1 Tax=Linum trigynum TaxID=586398 RepID=A0AAV2FY14_9ROSI